MEGRAMLDLIQARRSIRKYTKDAVAEGDVQALLEAAMAAPSGNDARPWEFVVVRDAALRAELSKVKKGAHMCSGAPVVLAVLADEAASVHWIADASAATENILLAAVALGLGRCGSGSSPGRSTKRRCGRSWDSGESPRPLADLGGPAGGVEAAAHEVRRGARAPREVRGEGLAALTSREFVRPWAAGASDDDPEPACRGDGSDGPGFRRAAIAFRKTVPSWMRILTSVVASLALYASSTYFHHLCGRGQPVAQAIIGCACLLVLGTLVSAGRSAWPCARSSSAAHWGFAPPMSILSTARV